MTAHGSPHTRFHRAVATRDPLLVRAAAAELPRVTLSDALAVCLVVAAREPERFPRYAVRWHARFCLEVHGLGPDEAHLALAAVLALAGPGREVGMGALLGLCERRGLADLVALLHGWED